MRKDAIIDRVQVMLPNSSKIGFGKWKAQFGDVIVFKEGVVGGETRIRHGRVAGRVRYAPALTETPAIRNHILTIVLFDSLTHVGVRWVNPDDVIECYDPQNYGGYDLVGLLSFFIGPDFRKEKTEDLVQFAYSGAKNMARYRELCGGRKVDFSG